MRERGGEFGGEDVLDFLHLLHAHAVPVQTLQMHRGDTGALAVPQLQLRNQQLTVHQRREFVTRKRGSKHFLAHYKRSVGLGRGAGAC